MNEPEKGNFLNYLRQHPEWGRPQSKKWYSNLANEVGEYEYPWKSKFEGKTAEMIFTEKLSEYITEDSCVLDVGCGHGEFTNQWSSKVKEVIGIDITEGFINTALRDNLKNNVRYLVVDAASQLPLPDNYFDVVYTKKGPWLHKEG